MFVTPFKPASRPLLRDLIIYLWGIYWLLSCLYKGKVELFDSVGFLVLYLFYIGIVVLGGRFSNKKVGDSEKPIDDIRPSGYL